MRLLDLFAGIGGFSLAAHWLGWETAAFVERDKFCQQVLRKNFGDVPIYDDICTFDGRPFRGAIDVISGGFPCQPFSVAGKQKGKDDERHLFPQMLRVISEVRPRWIVAENVRGLLNNGDGRVFEEICSHLESEDYSVQAFIVPASAVDAPHRRDRVWIVAANSEKPRNRAKRRAVRRPHGEISERHDNAKSRDADFGAVADADERESRSGNVTEPVRPAHVQLSPNNSVAIDAEGREGRAGLRETRPLGNRRQPRNGHRNVTDARDTRPQGNEFTGAFGEGTRAPRPITERFANESWLEAATRFCRVDDVVPDRVDRLKSLGNAVVPLVVYEFFRAIEETEHAEI